MKVIIIIIIYYNFFSAKINEINLRYFEGLKLLTFFFNY